MNYIHPPFPVQEFLSHSVYSRLLEKRLGIQLFPAVKQTPSEGEALSLFL